MLPLFNPCEAEVITTGLACVAPVIVFVGASVRSEAVVETLKLYEEPPVTLTVSPGENSFPLPPSIFNFLVDFTTSIAVAVAPETPTTGQTGFLFEVDSTSSLLTSATAIVVGSNFQFAGDSQYYRVTDVTNTDTTNKQAKVEIDRKS